MRDRIVIEPDEITPEPDGRAVVARPTGDGSPAKTLVEGSRTRRTRGSKEPAFHHRSRLRPGGLPGTPTSAPSLPGVRIAVLDLGSTSFRHVVVDVDAEGTIAHRSKERAALNLGLIAGRATRVGSRCRGRGAAGPS